MARMSWSNPSFCAEGLQADYVRRKHVRGSSSGFHLCHRGFSFVRSSSNRLRAAGLHRKHRGLPQSPSLLRNDKATGTQVGVTAPTLWTTEREACCPCAPAQGYTIHSSAWSVWSVGNLSSALERLRAARLHRIGEYKGAKRVSPTFDGDKPPCSL